MPLMSGELKCTSMSLGKRVMVSSRMNWLFRYQASARLELSWLLKSMPRVPQPPLPYQEGTV